MGKFLAALAGVVVVGVAGFVGWGMWLGRGDGTSGPVAPASKQAAPTAARLTTEQQALADRILAARAPAPEVAAQPSTPAPSEAAQPATFGVAAAPPAGAPFDPALIRMQVLLQRAGASPGVVDGRWGSNLRHALEAFAAMRGLPAPEGDAVTPELLAALEAAGGGAVVRGYEVTAQDVAGPFFPDVGEDLAAARGLERVGYVTPLEMLAERFHMDEALLTALNPGLDFANGQALAGKVILVTAPERPAAPAVARIEVDKAAAAVRGYDEADRLVLFFPATVGSSDRPSPSGTHKVVGVARDPDYTYDPSKLTWGPKDQGKFVVKPGPNNPVGSVWIDLDAPSYGLHGSPEPAAIGKTASHGCVRLTNWDALSLADAVKPGVPVEFLRSRG